MWGKAPQDVFLGSYLANIQTIGIDVSDFPERPIADELLEFQDRRVVSKDVAHHQNVSPRLGHPYQLFPMFYVDREWLLNEYILSSFQRLFYHFIVRHSRCRQCHC